MRTDSATDSASDGERYLRRTSFEQRGATPAALPNALGGYCPVELKEKKKWVAGQSEFQITYQGQVYQFTNAAALKRFVAAPEKYAPALCGSDAVLSMEEDRTVPGNIQHSAVWRGRLFLFASAANLAAFREDPARYANRLHPMEKQQAARPVAKEQAPLPQSLQPVLPQQSQQLQLPNDSL